VQHEGGKVYVEDPDEYGVSIYVIPKGAKPDIKLRRDGTVGPQRKLWLNEIPDKCTCGEEVTCTLDLTWKPTAQTEMHVIVNDGPIERREHLNLL
jgi:hypothetical protein